MRMWAAVAAGVLWLTGGADAQLRVCTWNVTNYNSNGTAPSNSRDADFATAIYGVVPAGLALQGQRLGPDVIIGQEFMSQTGVSTFLGVLNTAPGSPGDWAAAPFLTGPDTNSAFFYRTSKVQYLGTWTIALGSSSTCNQPRHTRRYDFRPFGYGAPSSVGAYSIHLKAQGSNAACPAGENAQGRRLVECQRIRANAAGVDTNPNWTPANGGTNPAGSSALPTGWAFIVAGDTNIQTAAAPDYQELVGSQPDNSGRVYDPIGAPGSWNNSNSYRCIHTQDPASQMDDRHDQILLGGSLLDGDGLDYIGVLLAGQTPLPWNLNTWNDSSHSYRCWGNDGSAYNLALRTTGNAAVGPTIAQALINSAAGNGHLPVYVDLRVGAKVSAPASIDFGAVEAGAVEQRTFAVGNAGDVGRWTANGIQPLRYTLAASAGLGVGTGPYMDAPGGAVNTHTVTLDTSAAGEVSGTITVLSNDPDQPSRVIVVSAVVIEPGPQCPACAADFNDSGGTPDDADVTAFFDAWSQGDPCADVNGSGGTPDDVDVGVFFSLWAGGGC